MAELDLSKYGITDTTEIVYNPSFEQLFEEEMNPALTGYDKGQLTDTFDMLPGGTVLNIPIGQWHSLKSLESGTVLFEAKDGAYAPLAAEDILQ